MSIEYRSSTDRSSTDFLSNFCTCPRTVCIVRGIEPQVEPKHVSNSMYTLQDYYLSVNDIFNNRHITTIVNFANRTKRLIVPKELDQTRVT